MRAPFHIVDGELVWMDHKRRREEFANCATHAVGAILSVAGLVALVVVAVNDGGLGKIVSFTLFGVAMTLVYFASTFYHLFHSPRVKHCFRVLDHIAIYMLIAGTYTPFLLLTMHSTLGYVLLAVLWGLAAVGTCFQVFHVNRFRYASLALYLAMGWTVLVAWEPAFAHISTPGMFWLLAGGVAYTAGVVPYVMRRLPYNHAIWHLFVLGGSICHFIAVMLYSAPRL